MMQRTLAAKIVVVAFAMLAGVVAILTFREGEHLAAAAWLAIVSSPAVAFVAGIHWCRWVVGVCAILSLVFWALSPAMQHAIDRTLGFWLLWVGGIVLLTATLWAAFSSAMKKPNKAPEPTPGLVTPRALE